MMARARTRGGVLPRCRRDVRASACRTIAARPPRRGGRGRARVEHRRGSLPRGRAERCSAARGTARRCWREGRGRRPPTGLGAMTSGSDHSVSHRAGSPSPPTSSGTPIAPTRVRSCGSGGGSAIAAHLSDELGPAPSEADRTVPVLHHLGADDGLKVAVAHDVLFHSGGRVEPSVDHLAGLLAIIVQLRLAVLGRVLVAGDLAHLRKRVGSDDQQMARAFRKHDV